MKKYLLLLLTVSCFASSSLVAMKKKDVPTNSFGSNQGVKGPGANWYVENRRKEICKRLKELFKKNQEQEELHVVEKDLNITKYIQEYLDELEQIDHVCKVAGIKISKIKSKANEKKTPKKNLFDSNQGGSSAIDQEINDLKEQIIGDSKKLVKIKDEKEKKDLLIDIRDCNAVLKIFTDIKKELTPKKNSFGTNQGISVEALKKRIMEERMKISDEIKYHGSRKQAILVKDRIETDFPNELKELRAARLKATWYDCILKYLQNFSKKL